MEKTYWWRIIFSFLSLGLLVISYIINNQSLFGLCDNPYSTATYQGCLDRSAFVIGKPLMNLSIFFFLVSPVLFFVRDRVFLRFLRFSGIWFALGLLPILASPVQTHGFLPLPPTRDLVAFWVGALFVPSAFLFLFFASKHPEKEKRS